MENVTLSDSRSMKSMVFLIITFASWFVIMSAKVKEINFLGMEFTDLGIPLLVLPPISGFFFYRFQCEFQYAHLIGCVLREYYSEKLQSFYNENLIELMMTPTFTNIELALKNMIGEKRDLSCRMINTGWNINYIFFTIIPLLLLVSMLYYTLISPFFNILWAIVSSALMIFFIVKSLLVMRISSYLS